MSVIEQQLYVLGTLDRLAAQDSFVHRRDPRAKICVTMAFVVAVLSFDPYSISALLPFVLYPVCLAAWGQIPFGYLGRKLCFAAPFVIFIGIFNPLFDTAIVLKLGDLPISAGWLSFLSILLRCALTVSAALVLVALTGFPLMCAALVRMGLPALFGTQLLLLYRYIFVLAQEAGRMERARDLRAVGNRGKGLRVYALMLGQLLLRTYDRATRIHQAMLCRGFTGAPPLSVPLRWQWQDTLFTLAWLLFFASARVYNLPQELGTLLLRIQA